jgi:hypothetical protein
MYAVLTRTAEFRQYDEPIDVERILQMRAG